MQALPKMQVITRAYTQADYTTLSGWWTSYKEWGTAVPEDLLSDDGYIVEVDGKPVAAGFLFVAKNSKCAWAEWIVADPKADKLARSTGIENLYEAFIEGSKKAGQTFVLTCTKHERLMGRLEDMGFMKGDTQMTMMIRRID